MRTHGTIHGMVSRLLHFKAGAMAVIVSATTLSRPLPQP
jgi:hypothetical protein